MQALVEGLSAGARHKRLEAPARVERRRLRVRSCANSVVSQNKRDVWFCAELVHGHLYLTQGHSVHQGVPQIASLAFVKTQRKQARLLHTHTHTHAITNTQP